MTTSLLPIADPDLCYCDTLLYDINQFNLKLRAYREPHPERGMMTYQYYVIDFFFTIFFKGQTFWKGLRNQRGSDAEMMQLVPFAIERREQMRGRKETHYPKLYRFDTLDGGIAYVMAGMTRVYTHESPMPLSIKASEKIWLASWEIVFEEGFAGDEYRPDFAKD